MKKSVMPKSEKYLTERERPGLHKHHIYQGAALRALSEKYGLFVYLTEEQHNMAEKGIHYDGALMRELHEAGQRAFMEAWPEENFMLLFGRNYLPEVTFEHGMLFGILTDM
jgi:hypothetical protein